MSEFVGQLRSFLRTTAGVAVLALIAAAAFYLFTQHMQHVFGVLPYLLILACPLGHMFMHRGDHKHHGSQSAEPRDSV